nr:Chain C, PB2 peptide from influenza, TYQWIIRNW [Influenza A virus]
TYQWIIRNW